MYYTPFDEFIYNHNTIAGGIHDDDRAYDNAYHLPASMDCACKPGTTKLQNKMCYDCSNIHPECSSCTMKSGKLECETCGDLDYMLSPDKSTCVRKIDHCNVPCDDQPEGLPAPANVDGDSDGVLEYWCERCDRAFFLNTDNEPGRCTACWT